MRYVSGSLLVFWKAVEHSDFDEKGSNVLEDSEWDFDSGLVGLHYVYNVLVVFIY